MIRLMKVLSLLAIALLSIDRAAAFSFTTTGSGTAAGSREEVIFSYSTADPFTLSSLTLTQPSTSNLLGGAFSPYITVGGSNVPGGNGTITEIITTTPFQSYSYSYVINPLANASSNAPFSTGISLAVVNVSPVPLPASLPLFAVALISLGLIGYRNARQNRGLAN